MIFDRAFMCFDKTFYELFMINTIFLKTYPVKKHRHRNEKWSFRQRYTYRVLQTIQMKLILLCVWAEVLGSAALKFKHEI